MHDAVRLTDWFMAEVERVHAELQASEEDEELFQVAEAVQRRGGEITVRDLMRHGPRCVRGDAKPPKRV